MLQRCRQQVFWKKKPKESNRKINYDTYFFSNKEWILYLGQSIATVGMLGYFFYGSFKWALLISPLVIILLKRKQRELCKARKQELLNQFKEMMIALNSSLQAGYSLENAFLETYKDMLYFYKGEGLIVRELALIKAGMRNGQPAEVLLQDLGERSGTEDILDFANILSIANKSGGNMNEILKSGISVIEEKIETKQEIQTLLSSKKLEAKIMSIIPFFIILYIGTTSKGYFDSMYQTMGGHIFMSICLAVYLVAVGISERIIEIEI